MKTKHMFQVRGTAWVPVRVFIHVEAPDEAAAMRAANRAWRAEPGAKRSRIVEGSEDYGAAHKFDALWADRT